MTMKRTISFFAAAYLSFGVNWSIIVQDSFDSDVIETTVPTFNYTDLDHWHVLDATLEALNMVVLNTSVDDNVINVPETVSILLLGLVMVGFGFARRNKRALNQNVSYRRRLGV